MEPSSCALVKEQKIAYSLFSLFEPFPEYPDNIFKYPHTFVIHHFGHECTYIRDAARFSNPDGQAVMRWA